MSILNNEITTPRQAKNGTRAFLCKRTNAIYTSHASGYVRRRLHPSDRGSNGSSGQYQLNKQVITIIERVKFNGRTFKTTTSKRVMIPNEADRLALIERRAESFRR